MRYDLYDLYDLYDPYDSGSLFSLNQWEALHPIRNPLQNNMSTAAKVAAGVILLAAAVAVTYFAAPVVFFTVLTALAAHKTAVFGGLAGLALGAGIAKFFSSKSTTDDTGPEVSDAFWSK